MASQHNKVGNILCQQLATFSWLQHQFLAKKKVVNYVPECWSHRVSIFQFFQGSMPTNTFEGCVAKQHASLADFRVTKKESQMSIIDTFIILSNSHHVLCLLKIPYLIFQTCQFWDSTSNSNFPFQIALWYKKKKFKKRKQNNKHLSLLPTCCLGCFKCFKLSL